ncbi:MAG: trypsin-like peptidase domain-containing protein [Gemmatimonadota bacterium]
MTHHTQLKLAALGAFVFGGGVAWALTSGTPLSPLAQALAPASAQTAPGAIDTSRRTAIVAAADRVGPSVVSVNVVATQIVRERTGFDDPFADPFFQRLFPPRERLRQVQGLGSGFIVSSDGYILTNAHVLTGATEVLVTLLDGRQLPARIVGSDPATDLAVLQVDVDDPGAAPLIPAPLGDSENLLIGEWAIAIGNPFGYLLADRNPSVTVGVISALGRDVRPEPGPGAESSAGAQGWSNMIQTDAAINPGNSGGPLVNARGEVIGVNAFIFSGGTGGSIGLGFAIPINRARRVLNDLVELGEIRRPWTGLHLDVLPPIAGRSSPGARVARVDPASPGARAGFLPGDVLTATDGRLLRSPLEWEGRLLDLPSGASLRVELNREDRGFELVLTPEDDPLHRAPRLETPFGADLIVVDATIASSLALRSPTGLLLDRVLPDSGFRRLGLREGDVLIALGDQRLDGAEDVAPLVDALRSGRRSVLYAERDGTYFRIAVR